MWFLLFIIILNAEEAKRAEAPVQVDHWSDRNEAFQEDQKEKCRDLKKGETKIVKNPFLGNSTCPHGFHYKDSQYLLTKVSDKKYKLHFPVVFEKGSTYPLKTGKPGIQVPEDKYMRNVIKRCFALLNPFLKDKNNMSFELSIDESSEAAKTHGVEPFKIKVQDEGRANVENFSASEDCSTYMHEFLHQAGLADEYEEPSRKSSGFERDAKGKIRKDMNGETIKITNGNIRNCRNVSQENSVMHRSGDAFGLTEDYFYCICEAPECLKDENDGELVVTDPNSSTFVCQKGYSLIKNIANFLEKTKKESSSSSFIDVPYYLISKRRFMGPNKPSLQPAHSRHLIYPGCQEKNKKFYKCSGNAYDASFKEGCPELPKYCSTNEWLK